jgi:hypothetical protein
MCESVPQIDVFRTFIKMSFLPRFGTGTSRSHKPGALLSLTNASIVSKVSTVPSRQAGSFNPPLAYNLIMPVHMEMFKVSETERST